MSIRRSKKSMSLRRRWRNWLARGCLSNGRGGTATATATARKSALKAADAKRALRDVADPQVARSSQWFFKTGPGEYGEGDRFLGIRVPERKFAREFQALPLPGVASLLRSKYHEERLLALLILVRQYDRGAIDERESIRESTAIRLGSPSCCCTIGKTSSTRQWGGCFARSPGATWKWK
ncbi:MAG: DNA alkylation repair protein [Longimicrobiales bacterium]